MLGMTPTNLRACRANEEIKFAVGQISLGEILVASSTKGFAAILLGDEPDRLLRDLQYCFLPVGPDQICFGRTSCSAYQTRRWNAIS